MKMFMLKAIFLVAIMFLCVLIGMEQANQGIQRMKGFEDSNFRGAFNIGENEEGDVQVSLLGNDVDSHDLQDKKEKLEEMKAFNLFSSLGKSLAEGISNLIESTIQFISDLMSK